MTRPKTRYPLEAFGPELMAALLRGSRERVIVKFEKPDGVGKKLAHSFQRRIHTLRSKMRDMNHEYFPIAARAKVSLFWGEKAAALGAPEEWKSDTKGARGAWVVIQPQDSEFAEVLAESGITPEGGGYLPSVTQPETRPGPATITPTPITPPTSTSESLDDFLDELQSIQEKKP